MPNRESEPFLEDITDENVRDAFSQLDRADFVSDAQRYRAYIDAPLPIGLDQTISQPSLVALMTQYLEVKPGHRVLEIGTGSGFQAAVLAKIAAEVYSVEIHAELAASARARLEDLGIDNVHVANHDGARGWPEHAPYDRIMITAAAPELPGAIWDQLRDGGKVLIPLGRSGGVQQLTLVTRRGNEREEQSLLPVRFVPFTGEK